MELPWRGLGLLALAAAVYWVLARIVDRAAKRFGEQRTADGEWDENGPRNPTRVKRWEEVNNLGYIGLHLDDDAPPPDPPGAGSDSSRSTKTD